MKIRRVHIGIIIGILLLLIIPKVIFHCTLTVSRSVPLSDDGPPERLPERPGIGELVITGPIISDLIFQIHWDQAGMRVLDWSELRGIDPNTEITISVNVDETGNIHLPDVKTGGQNEAGKHIREAIQTWRYTPYLTGRLVFWFNLPSKENVKLTIDATQLRRRETIPKETPIKLGKLYLIEGGIQSNEVDQKSAMEY